MSDRSLSWLDTEDEEPSRRSRSRLTLLALAGLPWLVVLGLLVSGGLPPRSGPADDRADAPTPDEGDEDAEPSMSGDDRAEAPPPPCAHGQAPADDGPRGARRDDAAERRAEAVALAVARAWLTDVGPGLRIEGVHPRADHYLEHAAVEAVDRDGDHAVVTLLAVVLEREGDAYRAAAPRRLAVPVALADGRASAAGSPWWLPADDLDVIPPDLETKADEAQLLALAEAVTAAGLADLELTSASRTRDGWWVAQADGELGDGTPWDTWLWLRDTDRGPVLAGLAHEPAPAGPPPAPDHPPGDHAEDDDPDEETS